MLKNLSKKEILQISLLGASVVLILFGILTMLTAGEMAVIFKGIADIPHMLVRYIIVILMMSAGIMTFSNVAMRVENKKYRNGLVIGITAFAFVLTLPLVYVFIAFFPGMNGHYGAVGEMMVKDIVNDAYSILVSRAAMTIFGIFGILLSIVFLAFPLVTGFLAVKGKTIKIGVSLGVLPVIEKQEKSLSESADKR
jgi:hypothetical protein